MVGEVGGADVLSEGCSRHHGPVTLLGR